MKKRSTRKPKRQTLAQRKRALESSMADGVVLAYDGATPRTRLAIAEHALELGLGLIGHARGLDVDTAIVLFPDEPITRLLRTIAVQAAENAVGFDDVVSMILFRMQGAESFMAPPPLETQN